MLKIIKKIKDEILTIVRTFEDSQIKCYLDKTQWLFPLLCYEALNTGLRNKNMQKWIEIICSNARRKAEEKIKIESDMKKLQGGLSR